jgi:hypothetical protein
MRATRLVSQLCDDLFCVGQIGCRNSGLDAVAHQLGQRCHRQAECDLMHIRQSQRPDLLAHAPKDGDGAGLVADVVLRLDVVVG